MVTWISVKFRMEFFFFFWKGYPHISFHQQKLHIAYKIIDERRIIIIPGTLLTYD
jgi:hypothetical protein